MITTSAIGVLFLGLAVVFLVAALRKGNAERKQSPPRRTWLRIALIFAVVGIGLQLVSLLQ